MTIALFAVFAAVALAAGVAAVWRAPTWAPVGLALGLAGVMLLYEATGLALLTVAAVGAAALVMSVARGQARGGAPADGATRPAALGARRIAAAAGVIGGLSFVLVGTWARQFLWTGRELAPGSGWGELPGLAGALAGAPGLLGVGLVIVVAAAACAGPPRHRI
ncbi:hypothetical protein [Nannocystis punicea]|uniref:NADH-quinone oxidoreductase subunit J n=1 Tax=Nannocystis punicea TaxID=2995304 RepID=A0ABY7HGK9_9BACT|nr:hypothetical protein [Nannocystis poenicansa]WAS98423.1 hypothetical protein O0S08_19960 [Nannocystis poenicansa]